MSDSTFIFPIIHSAGPAVTRQMFPTSPTLLLFVFSCSLVKRDNSMICIRFRFHRPPPVPCQVAKFIFSRAQRLIGSGTASEKQFISNYRKSLASVKVHSITPFLRPSPQLRNTGPDPVLDQIRPVYLFNLLIYFHGKLNLIHAAPQEKTKKNLERRVCVNSTGSE